MTPEPTPSQELEKLYQSDHSIGSHSDDRGGSADFPCYCQVKKRIEAYIKQHELSRKQEWVESLIKKLPLSNCVRHHSDDFSKDCTCDLINRDQITKTIKEQSKE